MAKAKRRLLDLAVRALPDAVEGDVRRALGLEVKVAPKAARKAAPKALPAPPKRLALPAPDPGLPPQASKPRGGQFWVDKDFDGSNVSPEGVARKQVGDIGYRFIEWEPDPDYGILPIGNQAEPPPEAFSTMDWLTRALAKYYKTDFGAPDDPLRDLAARGLHYDPEMTPEKWKATVDSYLMEDPIQSIMFPPNLKGGMPGAGSDLRGEALAAMPWLAKQPVTDKIYGISGGGLDLEHFADEFYNALNPEISGLPMEFAVRPESLGRMTFAQAAERVGRINQYRAKEMERAALAAQDNPVTQLFKDYAEDNPMGLRWVEIAPPKGDGPANYDVEQELSKALKYEGDTMGHCVGGYCPDVMSGRSRIFSLRDAKGEPHVTVETKPRPSVFSDLVAHLGGDESLADDYLARGFQARDAGDGNKSPLAYALEEAGVPQGQDIIQIKGKQNRAPKDDYLPFVQDFVKSQKWGNIGDIENTGLVRLPDGRFITEQQFKEGVSSVVSPWRNPEQYDPRFLGNMSTAEWEYMAPYFEGFAIGGRVDADRCFCHNPLSVKKGR